MRRRQRLRSTGIGVESCRLVARVSPESRTRRAAAPRPKGAAKAMQIFQLLALIFRMVYMPGDGLLFVDEPPGLQHPLKGQIVYAMVIAPGVGVLRSRFDDGQVLTEFDC